MSVSPRRSFVLVALSLGVVTASMVLAGVANAKSTAIAQGVRIESTHPIIDHHKERVHLLRIDLADKHVRLIAASPGDGIAAPRQTVMKMARDRHAIAGINANFFNPDSRDAEPVSGLVIGGQVIKTPKPDRGANLYVTPSGHARIGAVPFTGSVTRLGTLLEPAVTSSVYSMNTIADAVAGHITVVDRPVRDVNFGEGCSVVTGQATSYRQYEVVSVYRDLRSLARSREGMVSLVACGRGVDATWLGTTFTPGDKIALSGALSGGVPTTLVSGGRQLVDNGKRFTDASGPSPYGLNPLTFGCVSAGGSKVLLGTVDGRWSKSRGLTYQQLTTYMIGRLHCYDGLVFDGGGSSTMVARTTGHSTLSVVNRPSDGVQRRVATALLVVSR